MKVAVYVFNFIPTLDSFVFRLAVQGFKVMDSLDLILRHSAHHLADVLASN